MTGWVAPDEARDHLHELRAAGWTRTQISRATGLAQPTLLWLETGRRRWIQAATAELVLSVAVTDRPCHVCQDAEVLAAVTTDIDEVADRLGIARASLHRHLNRHGRADLKARLRWRGATV